MKFAKSSWPKTRGPVTQRRRLAAERKIIRERESMALFPELVRDNGSVEERLSRVDREHVAWSKSMRDHEAKAWREARRRLRLLEPGLRAEVIEYWNHGGCPKDPVYLLDHIRNMGVLYPLRDGSIMETLK